MKLNQTAKTVKKIFYHQRDFPETSVDFSSESTVFTLTQANNRSFGKGSCESLFLKNQHSYSFLSTVNKLRSAISPWGARGCSPMRQGLQRKSRNPAGAEELQRKARLVVFLYPRSGYKNTARPCNPGFWRGSAKKAQMFFLTC
ncbi:MAG: hypothetical protein LBT33_00620 [Spirochaetia bacterium]|jgi:hypothetical protein|nr:hypothetical protein [Spirochaetia bacterium]